MILRDLIKSIRPIALIGSEEIDIKGVNIDSRHTADGYLFIAIKGTQVDGHRFIFKAIEQGAKAILCEDMPKERANGITYIQVASTEDVVGKVATLF